MKLRNERLDEIVVLVVDDFADTRWAISHLLELHGFRVLQAEDGLQAMSQLAAGPADLIITDLHMGEMDGLAFIQAARALRGAGPRIIAMTGWKDGSLEVAIEIGADRVLRKPVGRKNLMATVRSLLTEPGS